MTREELIKKGPCDIDCPPLCFSFKNGAKGCCETCEIERKKFAQNGGLEEFTDEEKDIVRNAWDNKQGFASDKGCKLPRELMPIECLEYDCRDIGWFLGLRYVPELKGWQIASRCAVPAGRITYDFIRQYNELFTSVLNEEDKK